MTGSPICPLCKSENRPRFRGYRLKGGQGLFPERKYEGAEKVYQCKRCELMYNHPPVKMEDVFEKDDSLVNFTEQNIKEIKEAPVYLDILKFLKEELGFKPGARVLDIGSGVGMVSYKLFKEGYDTFAVEPKKELFDFALKNGLSCPGKSFNKSFDSAEFEPESFDFIFLEPLNHLTDPHEAIQKALGWIKPGGYLHLEIVNSRWLYKRFLKLFYKTTLRKHSPYTSAHTKPFNACEYSPESFKKYAVLNNLALTKLSSYPCDTFIANKFFDKLIRSYMERFLCGMELSVILKKP